VRVPGMAASPSSHLSNLLFVFQTVGVQQEPWSSTLSKESLG
jgi:hypothetical protein